jgi:LmbE family N-acetylglucosaminyl deacetylase
MKPIVPDLAARLDSILCVGAHADDIEIGCAGTLLQLLWANPAMRVDWIVLSATGQRADEARRAAAKVLGWERASVSEPVGGDSGGGDVRVEAFAERYFPAIYGDLKRYFDDLGGRLRPDLIFAPRRADEHQDHRVTAELVWQTFRAQPILEYEIVKYEGDLGRPNVYVALTEEVVDAKLTLLRDTFGSQRDRYWFDDETFRGLLRTRGVECRAPSGYAEAFHGDKLRLL